MLRELDIVVLNHDLLVHDLESGDVGTVVHIYNGGKQVEVEFVTGEGHTIDVVTLDEEDVRQMGSREILHARELKAA